MQLKVFLSNTLSRSKEEFVPIRPGEVRMYSCWPTVYSEPHLWNFRAFFLADLVRLTLEEIWWYEVFHVMNITDVGHLTDENNDDGEDKMEKGAKKLWLTVWEVAKKYEKNFYEYLDAFNIRPFSIFSRATDHIWEQIAIVQSLIDKGFTYSIPWDWIYLDTSKVDQYGKLAQLDIAWLSSQHREEWTMIDSSKKKNITDFALWKFSPHDQQRAMERVFEGEYAWALIVPDPHTVPDSRHGTIRLKENLSDDEKATYGFPWRHIECTAMASKYLGEHFDIHTGWVDHIPVHHTNEIAQAECCFGTKKRVNYRLHQQFLNVDWWKMSKSKWHDLSIPGIIDDWFSPLDIRYFFLTAQYSNFLDFTHQWIASAKKTRNNIIAKLADFANNHQITQISNDTVQNHTPWNAYTAMAEKLADDLNSPACLGLLHQYLSDLDTDTLYDILLLDMKILKIWLLSWINTILTTSLKTAPSHIKKLADERLQAKKDKDYARADALRESIQNHWWTVLDSSDGYSLKKA